MRFDLALEWRDETPNADLHYDMSARPEKCANPVRNFPILAKLLAERYQPVAKTAEGVIYRMPRRLECGLHVELSAAAKANAMKRYFSARLLRGQVVVGWVFFYHCMKLLGKVRREFSGYSILESGKRLLDRKPLQCSLYVTDRCNLDCAYCTEYNNSRPHPSLEDLKKWIRKIRGLSTMRIALVGGEPLMHPNIVELVRYCRELGFATSLTTNGFLLAYCAYGSRST